MSYQNLNYVRSHLLAKELLSKPDGYITMSTENEEYVVKGIKRKAVHANDDDSFLYWTLFGEECEGNIMRWDFQKMKENAYWINFKRADTHDYQRSYKI